MDKLEMLVQYEGFDCEYDFLEEFHIESCVPGICANDNCDYTTFVEPDQDRGYCEICSTCSVVSGLMLAGLV